MADAALKERARALLAKRRSAGPSGEFAGLLEKGNIDLAARPVVKNADGSISTVRSTSFNIDGREVLIPTVSPDGKILTNEDALRLYKQTGQHLGKFDTPEHATAFAENLHNAQANYYGAPAPASVKDRALAILERRKAGTSEMFNADRFGPAEKGGRVIPASQRGTMQGTELSVAERVGNALYDAAKAIGLPASQMRKEVQATDAFVRGAADVPTLGLSDEIAAAADTVTGLTGKRGDYDANLNYQRARDDYDAEAHPEARTAGQLTGGIAAGMTAAPRAAAANAWGRMKQGAVMGGLGGGAYGFGSGEGFADRAQSAATGAAVGTTIGLAIPAATAAISKGYNTLADLTVRPAMNALRSTVNPRQNAIQLTQRALGRDRLTPEQAAAKMDEAIAAGDDTTMLMDVAGDNTRRLGRFATNIPGEGADRLKEAVFDRQLAQPERIAEAVRKGLDDPANYFGCLRRPSGNT